MNYLLTGHTTGLNRRPRRINKQLVCTRADDARAAILAYMAKRRNAWEWLGVELTATAPSGEVVRLVYEGAQS